MVREELFKLRSPRNFIVGRTLPRRRAFFRQRWLGRAFTERNGAGALSERGVPVAHSARLLLVADQSERAEHLPRVAQIAQHRDPWAGLDQLQRGRHQHVGSSSGVDVFQNVHDFDLVTALKVLFAKPS
jgi:hypothetical protein